MTIFGGPLKPSQLFNYTIDVTHIVDGDTLDITIDLGFKITLRERVRLYGVDTKEIFGPKAEPAGQKSKHFTTEWVDDAKAAKQRVMLSVRKYDDREKYGRILAVIFRGDDPVSLNDALINANLAKPTPRSWGAAEDE